MITFAFTSRSSAASIPLNVETQTRRLGVPESIASFSASFGATIGQNGCAGLYPTMLAVMVAPTVGINPFDPVWIATLVGIVTLSSAGVAGVGGGATFAALIVLPAMGLPVTLVALLISIEPLIDMGRTALNVNGSMTAGSLTSRWLGMTDKSAGERRTRGTGAPLINRFPVTAGRKACRFCRFLHFFRNRGANVRKALSMVNGGKIDGFA